MKTNRKLAAAGLAALAGYAPALAADFEISGYASLVAGRTFGSCTPDNGLASAFSGSCTRFVADWDHAGVYSEHASLRPESRAGVRGTLRILPALSATAEVVARALGHPLAELERAFVAWSPSPQWTFQLGRDKLPLFHYSEVQDVGHAYPWVRLPPDVYGWDISNYNGAEVKYRGDAFQARLYAGAENSRRNRYSRLYYDEPKDVKWSRILGGDLVLRRDGFTGRLFFMRSGHEQVDRATGLPDAQPSGATRGHHRVYGTSVHLDHGPALFRSEYTVFDRNDYAFKARAWYAGAGYRFGRLTPTATVSAYSEGTRFPDTYAVAHWRSWSLGARYELGPGSAVKVQVDRLRDLKTPQPGTATLLSASYDIVF